MKRLIIHREEEDGEITRVYFAPEIPLVEIIETVSKFNTGDSGRASIEELPDSLVDPVTFLIKDRRIDVNACLEELRELKNDIRSMQYAVDDVIERIENQVNKQTS